jgi:insertion element IS1 protein InsB
LLERLSKWDVQVYCTDDWAAYSKQLEIQCPNAHHVITKAETVAIERNNSDTRHWIGRFHRKTKIVSKSEEMVDLSMALFARFRVNGTIHLLRNWRLSLLPLVT